MTDDAPPSTVTSEAQLRARFETRVERFAHGPVKLRILLPRSPEALIDEREFEADERLPYWAELWPSARALARHLLEARLAVARVLEIGCGVALPSLALRAIGMEVLATDYYEDALRFAEVNAARNGLPPLGTAPLDWRDIPPHFGRFDLVLAADVLYECRNVDALADALPRLLAPSGRLLLADPGRSYLGEFRTRMAGSGWKVRDVEVREETSAPATGAVSRVQLVELESPV